LELFDPVKVVGGMDVESWVLGEEKRERKEERGRAIGSDRGLLVDGEVDSKGRWKMRRSGCVVVGLGDERLSENVRKTKRVE
jgi:hypothetical protein